MRCRTAARHADVANNMPRAAFMLPRAMLRSVALMRTQRSIRVTRDVADVAEVAAQPRDMRAVSLLMRAMMLP